MADSKLDPNKSYGWTGKILRVNLTDKTVSVSPTDPYKEYLGGMGIANKIMYDEVARRAPIRSPRRTRSVVRRRPSDRPPVFPWRAAPPSPPFPPIPPIIKLLTPTPAA